MKQSFVAFLLKDQKDYSVLAACRLDLVVHWEVALGREGYNSLEHCEQCA